MLITWNTVLEILLYLSSTLGVGFFYLINNVLLNIMYFIALFPP